MSESLEQRTVRVVALTTAWTVLYAAMAFLLPAGMPGRAVLMDSMFLPAHALAAWALALVCHSIPRGTPRWWGFRALMLSQVVGVINSLVWIAASAGLLPQNSALYQLVGLTTTALSVYGIARLVPLRRPGTAAVPWLDITLLLLAGASIGWYFVGRPLQLSGAETTVTFFWFAAITTADTFSGLLALAAWTYPSDRIGRPASALFAVAYGLSAWGDVRIETGSVDGSYVSGQPFDIIFALTVLLMVIGSWRELGQAVAREASEAQVLTARAVTPLLASAAVLVPLILTIAGEATPESLVVPALLTVAFVLALQWRYLLLDREIERTLVSRLGLERDLALSRQFESLGRFAGAIAHDFNNILTALLAHVQLLKLDGRDATSARESLDIMEDSVQRGATLNRRLLSLMRGQEVDPVPTDLGAQIRAVADSVTPTFGGRQRLALSLPTSPVRAALRPGDADQLLLNLVVNARDASPDGGAISVRLRAEGHEAVLEVEDEGHGIPVAIRERIFEPLFTTKSRQQGTGLGLATVQAVVGSAGGTIAVWSEEGRGTRFTVRLPLVQAAAAG